ncbi:MIF4G domain [Carpediemonas membranifera]|uniref:MIF4G domain n=1 Tax=Carpediemonas membranifera TaxID=201153 RepID=A0A8J6B5Y7_9EUKA|nr:MIF4G domain [Carpediemonas membranifera]|eukprot:KAG9393764.1 MIF4G domain [Carpediemonas membranifera]
MSMPPYAPYPQQMPVPPAQMPKQETKGSILFAIPPKSAPPAVSEEPKEDVIPPAAAPAPAPEKTVTPPPAAPEPVADSPPAEPAEPEQPKSYQPPAKTYVPKRHEAAKQPPSPVPESVHRNVTVLKTTISLETLLEIGESLPPVSKDSLPTDLRKFLEELVRVPQRPKTAPPTRGGFKGKGPGPKGTNRGDRRSDRDQSRQRGPRNQQPKPAYKSVFGESTDAPSDVDGRKLIIDCKVIMNKMVKDNKDKILQELMARITGKDPVTGREVPGFVRLPDGDVTVTVDRNGGKETHYGKEAFYKEIIGDIFEMACRQPLFAPLYAETIVSMYHRDVFADAITQPVTAGSSAGMSAADLVGSKKASSTVSPGRVKRWTKRAIVELVQKEFQQMSELTEEEEQRLAACETEAERADFHAKRADHVRNNVLFIGELFVQSKAEIISKQVLFQSCFTSLTEHFKADGFVVDDLDSSKIECLVDLIKAVGPTLDQMKSNDERESSICSSLTQAKGEYDTIKRYADEEAIKRQSGSTADTKFRDQLAEKTEAIRHQFFHGKQFSIKDLQDKIASYTRVIRVNAERELKWKEMWVDLDTLVQACKEWELETHRPVRVRFIIQDLVKIREGNWVGLNAGKALSKKEAKQERDSQHRERLSMASARHSRQGHRAQSGLSYTSSSKDGFHTPRVQSRSGSRDPGSRGASKKGLAPSLRLFSRLSVEPSYTRLDQTISREAVSWVNDSRALDELNIQIEKAVDGTEPEDTEAALAHANDAVMRTVLSGITGVKADKHGIDIFFKFLTEQLKDEDITLDDLKESIACALETLVKTGSMKNAAVAEKLALYAKRAKIDGAVLAPLVRLNSPDALAFVANFVSTVAHEDDEVDDTVLADIGDWLAPVRIVFSHASAGDVADMIDSKVPGLYMMIISCRLATSLGRNPRAVADLPDANPLRSQTALNALLVMNRRRQLNATPVEALNKLKDMVGPTGLSLTPDDVVKLRAFDKQASTVALMKAYIEMGGDIKAVKVWAEGQVKHIIPAMKKAGRDVLKMIESL